MYGIKEKTKEKSHLRVWNKGKICCVSRIKAVKHVGVQPIAPFILKMNQFLSFFEETTTWEDFQNCFTGTDTRHHPTSRIHTVCTPPSFSVAQALRYSEKLLYSRNTDVRLLLSYSYLCHHHTLVTLEMSTCFLPKSVNTTSQIHTTSQFQRYQDPTALAQQAPPSKNALNKT